MRFNPLKEEELSAPFVPLKDGLYDFVVAYAEDKPSPSGKGDYIFIKLQVWDENGMERLIFTNLALIKLIKHFCDVTGLQDKYDLGEITAADCIGKCGKVDLGFEDKKPNPKGGYYPAKNVVKDYVGKSAGVSKQVPLDTMSDIPF